MIAPCRAIVLSLLLSSPAFAFLVGGGGGGVAPSCFGDGTEATCPFAIKGTAGHRCQDSASTSGAPLTWTGTSSLQTPTPCYAENDGPTFDDGNSMGGPGLTVAIRFTAPASLDVTRMEVFTGEGSGDNSLAFWSHDAANDRPLAQVSGLATWSLSAANDWQGGDLPASFSLTGGTTYWLAWTAVQGSQSSLVYPSAVVGQPWSTSLDGGQTWSDPVQSTTHNWKFRLVCAGGGSGSVTPFCPGDGTQAACPCGNEGTAGRGCGNSINTSGAQLTWTGTSSPDTLVMTSSGQRLTNVSIFYQSFSAAPPSAFGDGIRCLGSAMKKMFIEHAVGGVVSAPGPGDPTFSERSAALGDPLGPGSTRYYQVVYRDGTAKFCPLPTGSTFNASNGLTVVW